MKLRSSLIDLLVITVIVMFGPSVVSLFTDQSKPSVQNTMANVTSDQGTDHEPAQSDTPLLSPGLLSRNAPYFEMLEELQSAKADADYWFQMWAEAGQGCCSCPVPNKDYFYRAH